MTELEILLTRARRASALIRAGRELSAPYADALNVATRGRWRWCARAHKVTKSRWRLDSKS